MKIRVVINTMDNRRKIEKISETKSYFFKKMKTHKTLARWTKKKKREDSHSEMEVGTLLPIL